MSDVLFEHPSQFREKRAIWRLFEVAPFRLGLARGRIFRWFGTNIPLCLIGMQGDLDLVLSLKGDPSQDFRQLYETWEVKTTLISRDGRVSSSKSSPAKMNQLLGQMKKYRHTGSPCVGLLELFIYEDGALEGLQGPPSTVFNLIEQRRSLLARDQLGYRMIHLEHNRDHESQSIPDYYLGLKVVLFSDSPRDAAPLVSAPRTTEDNEPFRSLTKLLEAFVNSEVEKGNIRYGNCAVTFCHACERLITLSPRGVCVCRYCNADLISQMG